jgi:hypothetical protein
VPLSEICGENFCYFFDLMGCIYVVGATVWTCLIAFFRITYIKAQKWLKFQIGEWRLLAILLLVGVTLNVAFALLLSASDSLSTSKKICRHYSSQELEIFLLYQVVSM